MQEVIYNGDRRYPAPRAHPPPDSIDGIPTQAELDAYPRMFTWGELKGIIQSGDLELLMRNKALQARYDTWMVGMKVKYGSTENYLTTARLPWKRTKEAIGTYDPSSLESGGPEISLGDLTESTLPRSGSGSIKVEEMSTTATPGEKDLRGGGGADTPSSAGFVSLASLRLVNGKLKRMAGTSGASESGTSTPYDSTLQSPSPGEQGAEQEGHGEEDPAVYLRWDSTTLDSEKYAVLPNDWPYNIPYGVRHYCVWSKVPIAHPELVDYNPDSWSKIEKEGLGGFSGITPLHPFKIQTPPSPNDPNANPSQILFTHDSAGRQKFIGQLPDKDWYAADVAYSGLEMGSWAGKEYESAGGKEVGKMVRGLWDPRGWECLWFVNPPRLQSVPGFSHFHVFARRKTPEEIDASEAYWTGEV